MCLENKYCDMQFDRIENGGSVFKCLACGKEEFVIEDCTP